MKKTIINVLSSTLLLTAFIPSTAFSEQCPPGAKMKNMTIAQPVFLGGKRWSLASDSFKENHRYWNLFFIVDLPHANTKEEALKQGKEAFQKAAITNENPSPYHSDSMTYCDYAKEANYTITAAAFVENG